MDQDIRCKIIPSINDREVAPRNLTTWPCEQDLNVDTSLYRTWTGGIHRAPNVDEYL